LRVARSEQGRTQDALGGRSRHFANSSAGCAGRFPCAQEGECTRRMRASRRSLRGASKKRVRGIRAACSQVWGGDEGAQGIDCSVVNRAARRGRVRGRRGWAVLGWAAWGGGGGGDSQARGHRATCGRSEGWVRAGLEKPGRKSGGQSSRQLLVLPDNREAGTNANLFPGPGSCAIVHATDGLIMNPTISSP